MSFPHENITAFIVAAGLADQREHPRFEPLTGGVSSEIWLVQTSRKRFCVKRALPKLRVAADWQVPIERTNYEAAWLTRIGLVMPNVVPRVLAEDSHAGLIAMEYLAPENYSSWKADLLAGHSNDGIAAAIGAPLGRIHSFFARDPAAPEMFRSDDIFRSIRLEPYLIATGRAHPQLLHRFEELAARTAGTKRSVVHGDISPKNIFVGPIGPVFIDAECAWFGDPAFDVAFCLNHLLLKCLAVPANADDYLEYFDALWLAYVARVDWEEVEALEARVASLLPALFLARVDGKSPVEYIETEEARDAVRRVAIPLIESPCSRVSDVRQAWAIDLALLKGQ
jgi:aminoglycoside phosphotransferase (APT) family kinase protein